MSDPKGTSGPARHGNGARYMFLFLLGLVLGVVATVMVLRAWSARQDPFPQSVMNVQQWHMGQLRNLVEQNRCNATDSLPHLRSLRVLTNDVEPAFPDLRDDARFAQHASQLRARLDQLLVSPPVDCPGISSAMQAIGETCKGCHQDFRG